MHLKSNTSKLYKYIILLMISMPAYLQSNECSFDLWPWIAVSIDVTTCKADTVYGSSVYGIDVNAMQGNIAYGEMGCPLCIGCSCFEGIIGKDTLYSLINLEIIKANDSIDFNDTNQVEIFSDSDYFIPLFTPFAYKNGDTLAVCWVTNHNPPISIGGYGDPKAGIIHCISRTDNISKIDYSSINPGKPVSIHKEKKRIRLKKTDYKLYDLLGRSAKNPLRM